MNMGTGKVGHSSRDPVQGDPLNSDREMVEYLQSHPISIPILIPLTTIENHIERYSRLQL